MQCLCGLDEYDKVLELLESMDESVTSALPDECKHTGLLVKARCLEFQSKFSEAYDCCNGLLKVFRNEKRKENLIFTLGKLGYWAEQLKRYGEALSHFEEQLKVQKSLKRSRKEVAHTKLRIF